MAEVTQIDRYPKFSQRRNVQINDDPESRQRIKLWMGWCIFLTSLGIQIILWVLDTVGIGEIMSSLVNPVAEFMFIIWFWMLGVSITADSKRLALILVTSLMAIIPFLNILPAETLGIVGVILLTRSEDKGGIIGKVAGATQGNLKKAA